MLKIIVLIAIFTILPLFHAGFIPIHDNTQVQRVFEMANSLRDGMFPVRWVSDLGYGYGYPIFNFYSPLPYYVGGILNLLGLTPIVATKIMMMLGIILPAVAMYLFSKEFWGKWGGIISAALFAYAPYHAVQIYVRGDVGEFWAYGFIPLVFYSVWMFLKERNQLFILLGALSYAGIILSHNLTALMVTPFLLLFIFILGFTKKSKIKNNILLLLIPVIGIVLSAFYWMPALAELGHTDVLSVIGGGSDFRDHFVCISQLWNSAWGFAGSAPGCIDGISFKIGKIHILLSVMSVLLFAFFYKKTEREKKSILLLFLTFLVTTVFLVLEYSKPVWENLPFMDFFQFPWRFLLLISFFISFLAGASFHFLENIKFFSKPILLLGTTLMLLIILFFNVKLFMPSKFLEVNDGFYTNDKYLKWETALSSDEYLPKDFKKPQRSSDIPKSRIEVLNGVSEVIILDDKAQLIKAEIEAKERSEIRVNLAYFPSWTVYVDGKEIHWEDKSAPFQTQIGEGKHDIELIFRQTAVEILGNLISVAGIISVFSFLYSVKYKRRE